MSPPGRTRGRVLRATLTASVLGGAPSFTHAALADGGLPGAVRYGLTATRAVGTLVPPGRSSLVRGVAAHLAISFGAGELLARTVPRRNPALWGAVIGTVMGVVNVGWIGRRWFPAIAALPLGWQVADNAAFGAVFGAVVDGSSRTERRQ